MPPPKASFLVSTAVVHLRESLTTGPAGVLLQTEMNCLVVDLEVDVLTGSSELLATDTTRDKI